MLLTYTGEDATDVCAAFHRDSADFAKFLAPLRVSTLDPRADSRSEETRRATETHNAPLERDFRDLRAKLKAAGLFKVFVQFLGSLRSCICTWPHLWCSKA